MRKGLLVALGVAMLVAPAAVSTKTNATQAANEEAAKNANQARAALDVMVKALGGDAWLNMKNQMREGLTATFYHGEPTGGTEDTWEYHQWPDHDRVELTKHRDVIEFYVGRQGWAVTYRGKVSFPQDQVDEYVRRRDHSIETAVKLWMKDPNTILLYEGQHMVERHLDEHMVERHLGEQVRLISPQNEAVTILMDVQTHLPLSRSFQWRDPGYRDTNTDTEEYDDYHTTEGFPMPFSISRLRNDEIVVQYSLLKAAYNQQLPSDIWDVDVTARKIKK